MTPKKRTETTQAGTALLELPDGPFAEARKRAGTAQARAAAARKAGGRDASLQRGSPARRRLRPLRRAAAPLALGVAAVFLVAALAVGAVPGHAEESEQGAGMGRTAGAAGAAIAGGDAATISGGGGDAADPADAVPSSYWPVCGPMYGGYPAGASGDPSPEQVANMTARMDALYDEYDAILAEYGFVYREPANLTGAQMDAIEAEMGAAVARHDGTLGKIDALVARSNGALLGYQFAAFVPQATMAAVYQLVSDEHDDILRRHGFAISTPQLSEADERRLAERLDAVMGKMERVYEEYCPAEPPAPLGADGGDDGHGMDGAPAIYGHGAHDAMYHSISPEADALYAEYDAILAEYGFVYREPANLTDAQLERLDAKMWRLFEWHADAVEDLAGRLAPMLANGSITVADAFAKDERLADRASAEHNAILAEFGYVIVIPELSAADRDAMDKRLADISARIDAALDAAYSMYGAGGGSSGASGAGNGSRAAGDFAADSNSAEPPEALLPDDDSVTLDAFDEDEQRSARSGDEHGEAAAGYDYLTATPEPSAEDGTVVSEGLADIYGRMGAALDDGHSADAYSTAAYDGDGDEAYAAIDDRTS